MTLSRVAAVRVAALAALCLMPLAGVPGTAAAADPAGAPPRDPTTFAIQPATKDGPDQRARFDITAKPGASITDRILVTNLSAHPSTFNVYAADAFNTANGGFDVLAAGRESHDVGAWIRLDKHRLGLPAGKRAIIPFRLTVPRDARPGDHVGGIVVSITSLRRNAKGEIVRFDQRVGTRVYLRVPGPLQPQVTYTVTKVRYHNGGWNPFAGGDVEVTYTVRNTGNVRLAGRHVASIAGLLQPASARRVEQLPELLPRNEFQLRTTVDNARPFFRLTANTVLSPTAAPGDRLPPAPDLTAKTSFMAMSWPLTITVLLVIAVLIFVIVRQIRRLRRASAPPPAPAPEREPARL
jgi:Bacterial protein of unknown function (DUF916)